MKMKPLLLIGVILLVAITLSVLLSNQRRSEPTQPEDSPAEIEAPTAESTQPPEEAPSIPADEMEIAASERMTREEGRELLKGFSERVLNASSAVVRVRLELSQKVDDRPIEGEIRFDSLKPDLARQSIQSLQPRQRGQIKGEWEYRKVSGIVVSSSRFRQIDYPKHQVHDYLFSSTLEGMQKYHDTFRKNSDRLRENPLQDLIGKIPMEERLREVLRAILYKSSLGDEIHVVSRMPRPFIEAFDDGVLSNVFPHLAPGFGADVALRTDVLDAETGKLIRTEYENSERKILVTQHYTEIALGIEIPEDRFDLELPSPVKINAIHENLEQRETHGITYDEYLETLEGEEKAE